MAASSTWQPRPAPDTFHGSVYEFLRNEDLNARNYFAPTTAAKPKFRRNQYGGTIGGPVLKQRLFFFGDFQGQRQDVGVVRTSTVPTLDERNGVFTGVAHIFDPSTTVFTNGKICAQRISQRRHQHAVGSGRGHAA